MNAPWPLEGVPPALPLLAAAAVAVLLLSLTGRRGDASAALARLERRGHGASGDKAAGRARSGLAEAPASVRRGSLRGLVPDGPSTLAAFLPRAQALRSRLDRAGLPLRLTDFVLLCALGGVATTIFAHVGWSWPAWRAAAAGVLAATAGPAWLLRRRIARRERRFLEQLPDALDLVVRAVRSGLPVTEALNSISAEMRDPARMVFRDLCANIRIGMSLPDALAVTAERVPLPEFRFFAISLVVQQETGGNLAEILQNLSAMLRRRYQVRLKIKAMSSEARASALIIGALPFLTGSAIYWINPDYIAKLFIDPRGWLLLAAGGTSLALGLFVMSRMTRFEV